MSYFLEVKNRAISSLASDVTDVATSWTLVAGEGAKFPASGDFHVTCEDEIVKVTARTTDTLTVTRAQEGTTGAAHVAGKAVELRITAGIITEIQGKKAIAGWTANKLLKGAGAGADPTEIDHIDLTTGVHGVGSNYVAESSIEDLDLASHKSRHEWLGADQPSMKNLAMVETAVWYKKHWSNWDRFTQSLTGTGSAAAGFTYADFQTGTTNPSSACQYAADGLYLNYEATVQRGRFFQKIEEKSAAQTNEEWWTGFFATPSDPTTTQSHFGFRVLNGAIYASCGDGTTGNQVDTGVTVVQHQARELFVIFGANNIKFYVDKVLKATLTANRPGVGSFYFSMWLKTTEAANKEVFFYPLDAQYGEET